MASGQELKHRTKDETTMKTDNDVDKKSAAATSKGHKRSSMAKRGLRSLVIGVSIPLSLTLANIFLFGWSSQGYSTQHKPFGVPSLWALHSACLGSAALMGLSAWLVWAEGGFHRDPTAIALYLGQLVLGLAWDPIFFKMGATRVGLGVCFALLGGLAACSRKFGRVNPIAGDLVRLCLVWAGLLSFVNFYFLFHCSTHPLFLLSVGISLPPGH